MELLSSAGRRGLRTGFLLSFISVTMTIACAKGGGASPNSPNSYVTASDPDSGSEAPSSYVPLAWEIDHSKERKSWSLYVFKMVDQELPALDRAEDAPAVCPSYRRLSREERINFWGMLISEVSYYESGWDPTSRMREPGLGTDPVTHEHVYSEGLLQMSYQDSLWNPGCDFNWAHDRDLRPNDPRKTILNPYINLKCGIHVLAKQVAEKREILLRRGLYWSTLRRGSAIARAIVAKTRRALPFCRVYRDVAFY